MRGDSKYLANASTVPTLMYLKGLSELKVKFIQESTGALLPVRNPDLKMYKGSNEVDLVYVKHLQPMGTRDGEFSCSFLTDNLTAGKYNIKATGYYPDDSTEANLVTHLADFDIFDVSSIQQYLNMLRIQLDDYLPSKYLIDNPNENRWSDTDLFNALQQAVNYFNDIPPTTASIKFKVETMPYVGLMMMGAEYFALNQKEILEIFNTIQYNDDISFTIDRSPKIHAKAEQILQLFKENCKAIKKDMIYRNIDVKMIKSSKLPLRALRFMSFIPQFSFVSSGFAY